VFGRPKIHPWLAESYSVSDDELTWTFKLRKGAKLHSGDEVTAEAVKYSMERLPSWKKHRTSRFMRSSPCGFF